MNTIKLLIIIINIILFLIVFYNIFKQINTFSNKEAYENIQEISKIQSSINNVKISNTEYPTGFIDVPVDLYNVPLTNFCIKSSYNSSYSGDLISESMVQYVLSRGCRFLDFEIYNMTPTNNPSPEDNYDAYIGYSNNKDAINPTISNIENISLFKMLKTTLISAFSKQVGNPFVTTNTKDPLFIQLRIKGTRESKIQIHKNIKKVLDTLNNKGYDQHFFNGPVYPTNSIKSLMKKVIFIFEEDIDENINADMKNIIGKKYRNMTVNTPLLLKKQYDDVNLTKFVANPPQKTDKINVDVKDFTLVVPEKNIQNLNVFSNNGSFIKDYGYQMVAFQYYNVDDNLLKHEEMFKHYNGGIVPMSNLLNYIDTYK